MVCTFDVVLDRPVAYRSDKDDKAINHDTVNASGNKNKLQELTSRTNLRRFGGV